MIHGATCLKFMARAVPRYGHWMVCQWRSTEVNLSGVMGASGSGKSTLLHLLGLLDRPTSGSLLIDGVDVGRLDERGRTLFRLQRLGYVFQDYALVPELTAEENVYLPSMVRGMTSRECSRVCGDILTLVGLEGPDTSFPR